MCDREAECQIRPRQLKLSDSGPSQVENSRQSETQLAPDDDKHRGQGEAPHSVQNKRRGTKNDPFAK